MQCVRIPQAQFVKLIIISVTLTVRAGIFYNIIKKINLDTPNIANNIISIIALPNTVITEYCIVYTESDYVDMVIKVTYFGITVGILPRIRILPLKWILLTRLLGKPFCEFSH